ncbi:MAG: CYTH domain-containing protein [Ilumatobacteraceae bacterium]|jgi:CYTH domain-containing protein|nr:CYTH domain-containing protein [Ilumatobacteraceae bacterium]
MGIERERKFLLHDVPADLGPGRRLRQGYLTSGPELSVRIRDDAATSHTLTVKSGGTTTRTEVEVALAAEQFEALWPLTAGRRIDKVRHVVPLDGTDGLVAEVDVFADSLDGLVVVEVEFADDESMLRFVPPDWFGREVSDDPAYTNAVLAERGLPDGR